MHMVDEMKLDQYMICLEVVDYYPDANIIFWPDYLEKHVQGKVHILSYRAIKQEIQKRYTSNKFVWIFGMVKSYEVIGKYIGEQNKEDAIVIVGGERLASCCVEKAISSLKIEDKYSNLHLQEDEDWIDFSKNIDELYGKYQSDISGLVLICNVNNTIADRINKELETSNNMSISRTEILGYNCESLDNATKVLREIKGKSLQEALEIIRKNLCFSGMYYAAKGIEEETKRKLRKEILEKMSICLPLSVIEQKNYYLKNEISDELDKKHCRLQQLKREYAIMLKGNRVEDNDVQTIAREIDFLSKELINKHPYYMPLNKFEGTNWEGVYVPFTFGSILKFV